MKNKSKPKANAKAPESTRAADPSAKQSIDQLMADCDKKFGTGAIQRLGSNGGAREPVKVISSGSARLDLALGIGGYPRGRVIEVFGPESSGKTTLTLHALAQAQRDGGIGAFIDAEHALDVEYARALGVRTNDLLISQPDHGEQALEIASILISSNALDIVVIDSVAALVPKAEIEGEMGDSHVGLQARLMSQALRKLTGIVARSRTVVFFINQLRMKIGVQFGNPETTTGGNALKFYASVRLDIRRKDSIGQPSAEKRRDGEGYWANVRVVKNKMAPPFKEALVPIRYGTGIWDTLELVNLGRDLEVIQANGTWLSYGGQRLGQGEMNAEAFLAKNPDLATEIRQKILTQGA